MREVIIVIFIPVVIYIYNFILIAIRVNLSNEYLIDLKAEAQSYHDFLYHLINSSAYGILVYYIKSAYFLYAFMEIAVIILMHFCNKKIKSYFRITEKGIINISELIKWENIIDYKWNDNMLTLNVRKSYWTKDIKAEIDKENKEEVNNIMVRRILYKKCNIDL